MPSRRQRRRSDWARTLPSLSPDASNWSDCDVTVSDSSTSSSSPNVSYDHLPPPPIRCHSSSSSSSSTSSRLRSSRPLRSRRHAFLADTPITSASAMPINLNDTHFYSFQQQQQQQHRRHHQRHHHHRQHQQKHPHSLLDFDKRPNYYHQHSHPTHNPLTTNHRIPVSLPSSPTIMSTRLRNSNYHHHRISRPLASSNNNLQQQQQQQQNRPPPISDMRNMSFSEYTAAELPDLAFLFRSFLPSSTKPRPLTPTTDILPILPTHSPNLPPPSPRWQQKQKPVHKHHHPSPTPRSYAVSADALMTHHVNAISEEDHTERNLINIRVDYSHERQKQNVIENENENEKGCEKEDVDHVPHHHRQLDDADAEVDLSGITNNSPSFLAVRLEVLFESTCEATRSLLSKMVSR